MKNKLFTISLRFRDPSKIDREKFALNYFRTCPAKYNLNDRIPVNFKVIITQEVTAVRTSIIVL